MGYSNRRLRNPFRHRGLRVLLALILVFDTLRALSIFYSQTSARLYTPPPSTKRIYIASQHWNTARLLRDRWNDALLALVKELGPENVFVAIYESGSFDDTKDVLRELDQALGELNVQRNITLSEATHEDEIKKQPTDHGWIKIPEGQVLAGQDAPRRIPFLATLRNYVLEPLQLLSSQGHTFDSVLFLNDVVFSSRDVLTLLDTNQGEYAAACSIDFQKWPNYYDTFALRDSQGHETVTQIWPYFRSRASRQAMESFAPVPVSSCWNGMVVMPVEPFLAENPLRFRGISDSLANYHVEGSECCLIHADNPLSGKGVFMNPNVRVGYNATVDAVIHSHDDGMSPVELYTSIWYNRIIRWATTPMFREWKMHKRVNQWKAEGQNHEPGGFCLVNEMQVLHERGWRHV